MSRRRVRRGIRDTRMGVAELGNGHRTVDRIAAILELAVRNPEGVRLGAVASELDAPKSSIHSLIRGLLAVGYLAEKNGSYVSGPGLSKLVPPSREESIEELVHDDLARLRDNTQETAILGMRIGNSIVYTLQLEAPNLIRYAAPMLSRRPLTTTSIGKIVLADLDERALGRVLRDIAEKEDFAEDRLREELDVVRRTGISFNLEESIAGVVATAAGLYGPDNSLVAAISVAGPTERMRPALKETAELVLNTARVASRRLGATPPER